jgi:hypothetical protein
MSAAFSVARFSPKKKWPIAFDCPPRVPSRNFSAITIHIPFANSVEIYWKFDDFYSLKFMSNFQSSFSTEEGSSEPNVAICEGCQEVRCSVCGFEHHPGISCQNHYSKEYLEDNIEVAKWIE